MHSRLVLVQAPFSEMLLGGDPEVSLMLGVKYDNRESVHDPKKVVLTPNIGLEGFDEWF